MTSSAPIIMTEYICCVVADCFRSIIRWVLTDVEESVEISTKVEEATALASDKRNATEDTLC